MLEPNYFSLKTPSNDKSSGALFSVGVPLPKGRFFAIQQLVCCRDDEKEVSAAVEPTAFWPDNSLKWVQVHGETTCEGLEKAGFTLCEPQQIPPYCKQQSPDITTTPNRVEVHCADTTWLIDTDQLFSGTLTVAGKLFQFGVESKFRAPYDALQATLSDWHITPSYDNKCSGEAFFIDLTLHYQLISKTPETLPLEFTVTLKYFTHFGYCEFHSTLLNPNPAEHAGGTWDLGDQKSLLIEDFGWFIKAEDGTAHLSEDNASLSSAEPIHTESMLWQRSSNGPHWDSPVHVNHQRELSISNPLSVIDVNGVKSEQPVRLMPAGNLQQDETGLRIVPQKFWQNFPTAITAGSAEICWHFFKAEANHPVELQPGEQKSHCCELAFSINTHRYVKATARLNPEWVTHCAVIPWFSAALTSDPLQSLINLGQTGEQNFFAKRERIDEYGWRNFGDLYADHETAEHQGNELFPSHYNNQYDPLYGFLKQWLLSGDEKWKELADDLARHIIDIDIYHCDYDKPEYNNGLFWHTDHYLPAETASHRTYSRHHKSDAYQDHAGGGGPGGQHCYTSGLQLYYFLTGCLQAKKAVLGLADWISQVYESDGTLFGLLLQFKNRHRKDLKQFTTGQYPFDRGTANYMVALLDSYELTGNTYLLNKVAYIIRHTVSPVDNIEDDRDLTNVEESWFYTVFLQALCRYLTVQQGIVENSDYNYAKACLLHYAKWMAENEYPYLEKPDILEYPNQTWSAQDLRKVHVLAVAAAYAEPDQADRFMQKATALKEYVITALSNSSEREYTRILALVMQNYGVDTVLASIPTMPGQQTIACMPVAKDQNEAGWQTELLRVIKQFSPQYEWQQLQKRIPKLRTNRWL